MQKVLVLDGRNRSALAATRSLGKKGVPVVVADQVSRTIAGSSRFCQEQFVYPSPDQHAEDFIRTVKEEIVRRRIQMVLPTTEITTSVILENRKNLNGVTVPFASFRTFDLLTNKWKLMELARKLGIACPATYFIKTQDDLRALRGNLKFPVVLKPFRSRICWGGRWLETSVHYAWTFSEIERVFAQYEFFKFHPFMVQEWIHGHGEGVFALYDQGKEVAYFAHRRLRENPPSGGVSVLSESIVPNPKALAAARRLLEFVKWHGVAMVEFKVAKNGTPYLMEVNARFWGSLQLAIDAGVDFPWLLYQIALGKPAKTAGQYRLGVKNRWLLGDVAHLIKSFARSSPRDMAQGPRWRTLVEFFDFFDAKTHFEINRWDDLRPFVAELKQKFLS